ncbi:FUSC family protein [Microbacterium sp. SSW1-59]|uniref:FUSC family protein n=1 Tax=Microbacterium xanthum TaxID=3079794 RepID=UPI002AD5068C|nr:FUSC family protein [Microbacterium sp. SSW1-59]MDZ8200387.1 FUSC family protein [Microbacterium sp. SSW1-59]
MAHVRANLRDWRDTAFNRHRMLLAAKTAVAAAIAWAIVPLLPFVNNEYSYYAPFGVLVVMYPTVAATARTGGQTLLGLAIGIGLGVGALGATEAFDIPPVIPLATVVAIGVLLGGIRHLGAGRDILAVAAVFVLLLAGQAGADDYPLSYLVTMGVGVVVGLAVNLIVVPPLYFQWAGGKLSTLRDTAGNFLETLADHVEEPDPAQVDAALSHLDAMIDEVRREVTEAEDSARANPRGRRHQREREENAQRLQSMELTVAATRDLAEVVAGRHPAALQAMSDETKSCFAEAIRACATLTNTAIDDERLDERVGEASRALERYLGTLPTTTVSSSTKAQRIEPAIFLRRLIDASTPFASDSPSSGGDRAPSRSDEGDHHAAGRPDEDDDPRRHPERGEEREAHQRE